MSDSVDDSSQTSRNPHGIVLSIVVVLVIIIVAVASSICSRVFCPVEYNRRDPNHGNHHPSQGRSSHNLQLVEEGRIHREANRHRQGNRDTSHSCCSVCLVDYKKKDKLRSLPDCNHLFHRECIDPWLRLNPTCPICRKSPMSNPESVPIALAEAAALRSGTRAR